MPAILQTTFSSALSWMEMYEVRLKFHLALFLGLWLILFQHWFRLWLGADQATSHYLNQWWLVYWCICVTRPQWINRTMELWKQVIIQAINWKFRKYFFFSFSDGRAFVHTTCTLRCFLLLFCSPSYNHLRTLAGILNDWYCKSDHIQHNQMQVWRHISYLYRRALPPFRQCRCAAYMQLQHVGIDLSLVWTI